MPGMGSLPDSAVPTGRRAQRPCAPAEPTRHPRLCSRRIARGASTATAGLAASESCLPAKKDAVLHPRTFVRRSRRPRRSSRQCAPSRGGPARYCPPRKHAACQARAAVQWATTDWDGRKRASRCRLRQETTPRQTTVRQMRMRPSPVPAHPPTPARRSSPARCAPACRESPRSEEVLFA